MGWLGKAAEFLRGGLWHIETEALPGSRALPVQLLRLLAVSVREMTDGQITLRAMSLVYTTLLSVVPFLAFSFSVLKGFGVHNQVEPLLLRALAPLGPRAADITATVIGFVGNLRVGVLGSVGLALLIYTVISLVEKIEEALNFIWRVRHGRSLARRFSDYLSAVLIGPVLLFSGLSLTASLTGNVLARRFIAEGPLAPLALLAAKVVPFAALCLAFTALYVFVPSTKVRWRSAAVGGFLAVVLWELVGLAFTSFIVTSSRYSAIYSGFAILVLLLIWVYASWLILLVGAKAAFYHQYPQAFRLPESYLRGHRLRERLALAVMTLVARSFVRDEPRWTFERLVRELGLPVEPVSDIVALLQGGGLLVESRGSPPGLLPGKALSSIPLREILGAVRAPTHDTEPLEERHLALPELGPVFAAMEGALGAALGELTLLELVTTPGGGDAAA